MFARDLVTSVLAVGMIVTNGGLHYFTDYFTSRRSSQWFASALQAIQDKWRCDQGYGTNVIYTRDPGPLFHNFFVVIGFDQLIHQVTFAVLMTLIFGGP